MKDAKKLVFEVIHNCSEAAAKHVNRICESSFSVMFSVDGNDQCEELTTASWRFFWGRFFDFKPWSHAGLGDNCVPSRGRFHEPKTQL